MYVFNIMNLTNLIGVKVYSCVKRENSKTYFTSQNIAGSIRTGYVLLILTKGTIRFFFKDRQISMKKGDIICLDPLKIVESQTERNKKVSYFLLSFSPYGSDGKLIDILEERPFFFTHHVNSDKIFANIRKLIGSYDDDNAHRKMRCSIGAMNLLEMLVKEGEGDTRISTASFKITHPKIRHAVETIYRNYKKVIEVNDLAKTACMHPASFSRLFSAETGLSPRQYILHFKIRKAKDFIHLYDAPLQFTAAELGFNDYSHFFRVFKKVTGETPLHFARSCKKGYRPNLKLAPI
ncbi:MAG: AraC family transcriptional regulator [Fibrobacteres bacterium]|nr:AraC family transcriptional regulator [Fibrobacterota bacterium]